MSLAFGEPPALGVMKPASVGGAVSRETANEAPSARTTWRRVGAGRKAAAFYLEAYWPRFARREGDESRRLDPPRSGGRRARGQAPPEAPAGGGARQRGAGPRRRVRALPPQPRPRCRGVRAEHVGLHSRLRDAA